MIDKEIKIIELFNTKFGIDVPGRIKALTEEFEEFKEAFNDFEAVPFDEKGNEYLHLQDEAADLYSVALHLIHVLGLNHETSIDMTNDKLERRKYNPNYKKEW